ncbi:MAG: hypothetical protein ACRCXT_23335 [Paraclostridium sp.]
MTQEQFDQKLALYTDEYCSNVLAKADGNNKLELKIADAMKIALILLEASTNKEDMTNWHVYAEKYLLGMNEETKEK